MNNNFYLNALALIFLMAVKSNVYAASAMPSCVATVKAEGISDEVISLSPIQASDLSKFNNFELKGTIFRNGKVVFLSASKVPLFGTENDQGASLQVKARLNGTPDSASLVTANLSLPQQTRTGSSYLSFALDDATQVEVICK